MADKALCSIPGCSKPVKRRRVCYAHHKMLPPYKRTHFGIGYIEDAIRDPRDDCMIWPLSCDQFGYGIVHDSETGTLRAHRSVCIRAHGPPPKPNMHARHTCDNPPCYNPRHLEWGTAGDNVQDSFRRRRRKTGENHYNSKLSNKDVADIRASDERPYILAAKYGVSYRAIRYIKVGRSRKWD
jgi:hypothetical protein